MFETKFVVITEMWQEGKYSEVGHLINREKWDASRVAEFCAYLNYHLGTKELSVFYKFL
jgi:saccharopine dehydrogenase-like NADP-dependent oxidoreductase